MLLGLVTAGIILLIILNPASALSGRGEKGKNKSYWVQSPFFWRIFSLIRKTKTKLAKDSTVVYQLRHCHRVLLVPPATPVVQLVFANAIDVAVLVAVVDQVVAKFGREFIK